MPLFRAVALLASMQVSESETSMRPLSRSEEAFSSAAIVVVTSDSTAFIIDPQEGLAWLSNGRTSRRVPLSTLFAGRPVPVIHSAGLYGDSLWLWSGNTSELMMVHPSTTSLGRRYLDLPVPRFDGAFFIVRLVTDSHVVVEEVGSSRAMPYLAATGRLVLRVSSDGAIDTLGTLHAPNVIMQLEDSKGRVMTARQPWAAADILASSSNGHLAFVHSDNAATLEPHAFRLVRHFPRTDSVRITYEPVALDAAVIDSLLTSIVSGPFGQGFSTSATARRRVGEALFRAKAIAPVRSAIVAEDGSVWANVTRRGSTTHWISWSSDGLFEMRIPSGVSLRAVSSGRVWTSHRDQSGRVRFLTYAFERNDLSRTGAGRTSTP